MPTYEYVCTKCGHQFEKFQSMKDDALKTCPADLCGRKKWAKGKVERQMGGGAGLIFKGSGFYITDYRSKGYTEAAKKDSSSSSPAAPAAAAPATPVPAATKPATAPSSGSSSKGGASKK
jgi:putative FmdB family regulatory protein